MWKVRMNKQRSTWHYFTTNPQDGGFGSNYCGSKRVALKLATRNIPIGEIYSLEVNYEQQGEFTRGQEYQI